MYFKRLVGIFVCLVILTGFMGQVHAVSNSDTDSLENRGINPQMTYISDAGSYITITRVGEE